MLSSPGLKAVQIQAVPGGVPQPPAAPTLPQSCQIILVHPHFFAVSSIAADAALHSPQCPSCSIL